MRVIRTWIEGFLEGRDQGPLGVWLLAAFVVYVISTVRWGFTQSISATPQLLPDNGPVMRTGFTAVVICGKKSESEIGAIKVPHGPPIVDEATKHLPRLTYSTWSTEVRGECTVWYHSPPGKQ